VALAIVVIRKKLKLFHASLEFKVDTNFVCLVSVIGKTNNQLR